jgi:hypothetical protein
MLTNYGAQKRPGKEKNWMRKTEPMRKKSQLLLAGVGWPVILFIFLSCGSAHVGSIPVDQQTKTRGAQMDQQKGEIPTNLLHLPEQDYFDFSDELQSKMTHQLSDTSFRGIAITAPRTIRLDSHDSFPVILFSQRTGLRDWEVNMRRNTAITAVNLRSGKIYQGHAFSSPKKRDSENADRSMEGPPPEPADARSISSGAERLDARGLLMLPWETGRYAITVTYYDMVSNTAVVELVDEKQTVPTSERASFPVEQATSLNEKAPVGGQPDKFPHFIRSSRTPDLKDAGVALALPADVSLKETSIPFYGIARVPVPTSAIVALHTQAQTSATVENKNPTTIPTAVLTGLLMFVQKDLRVPLRVDLQIPIYTKAPIKPGDVVEGFFGIDLASQLPQSFSAGTYQVYLAVGEHIAGPYRIIVSSGSGADKE